MAGTTLNAGAYKQISATGNVAPIPGVLLGIFVSSASSTPTITVYDSATTTTTTKIVDTFTPAAGNYYQFPVGTQNGIYVVLGGTVSATVVFA